MDKILLVIGPAGSGKSTYIYNNFKDCDFKLFDIYNFQEPNAFPSCIDYETRIYVGQALFECEIAKSLNKINEDILIIEGTYLKKNRRAPLIQTIKNNTDKGIECVFITKKNCIIGDTPTEDEGFSKVYVLYKEDLEYSEEELNIAKELNKEHRKIDCISENDLLGYKFVKSDKELFHPLSLK